MIISDENCVTVVAKPGWLKIFLVLISSKIEVLLMEFSFVDGEMH